MLKATAYIILYLSNLSAIPAILTGRKSKQILWYYAIACFMADALSFVLKQNHLKHAWVTNAFLLTEFITITTYFKAIFLKKKYHTVFILLLCLIGLVFCYRAYMCIINAQTDKEAFNYIDASLFYVSYIILSLAGLYKVISELQTTKIEQSPLFLSSIAFLLYASGALFPFVYKNIAIEENMPRFDMLWMYFFLPLNILKNLLLAFSLHCAFVSKHRQFH